MDKKKKKKGDKHEEWRAMMRLKDEEEEEFLKQQAERKRQMAQQQEEFDKIEKMRDEEKKKMIAEHERLKKEEEEANAKKAEELKRLEEEKKKVEEELKRIEEEKRKFEEQQNMEKAIERDLQLMTIKREEEMRKQQREEEIKRTISENEKKAAQIYESLHKNFNNFLEQNKKAQESLDAITVVMDRLRQENDASVTAMDMRRKQFHTMEAEVKQEEKKESEEKCLKITLKRDNTSWNIDRTFKEQQEQKKLLGEEMLRTLKKGPRERITPEDRMAEEDRLRSLKRGARSKITPEERIAQEKRKEDELERLRSLKKGPREKLPTPEMVPEEESSAVAAGLTIERDLEKFVGGDSDRRRIKEEERRRKEIDFFKQLKDKPRLQVFKSESAETTISDPDIIPSSPPHESPARKSFRITKERGLRRQQQQSEEDSGHVEEQARGFDDSLRAHVSPPTNIAHDDARISTGTFKEFDTEFNLPPSSSQKMSKVAEAEVTEARMSVDVVQDLDTKFNPTVTSTQKIATEPEVTEARMSEDVVQDLDTKFNPTVTSTQKSATDVDFKKPHAPADIKPKQPAKVKIKRKKEQTKISLMTRSMKTAIAKKATPRVQSFVDSDDEDFVLPATKPAPQPNEPSLKPRAPTPPPTVSNVPKQTTPPPAPAPTAPPPKPRVQTPPPTDFDVAMETSPAPKPTETTAPPPKPRVQTPPPTDFDVAMETSPAPKPTETTAPPPKPRVQTPPPTDFDVAMETSPAPKPTVTTAPPPKPRVQTPPPTNTDVAMETSPAPKPTETTVSHPKPRVPTPPPTDSNLAKETIPPPRPEPNEPHPKVRVQTPPPTNTDIAMETSPAPQPTDPTASPPTPSVPNAPPTDSHLPTETIPAEESTARARPVRLNDDVVPPAGLSKGIQKFNAEEIAAMVKRNEEKEREQQRRAEEAYMAEGELIDRMNDKEERMAREGHVEVDEEELLLVPFRHVGLLPPANYKQPTKTTPGFHEQHCPATDSKVAQESIPAKESTATARPFRLNVESVIAETFGHAPDDFLPPFDEPPSPASTFESDDFVPPTGLSKGCKRINAVLIASLKELHKEKKREQQRRA
jgi:hypothetical protein